LKGRRIGLITNHTGINREGVSTVRLLHDAKDVQLVALFSPEHGLEGKFDVSRIADSRDGRTGLTIYSLYGETRKPTAESLADIDTLVFDIQDIGARFYTYVSTMGLAMQVAEEHGKRFVVLDRPNPINGIDVQGPVLDDGRQSFVGFHTLPVRHGMTVGELAEMFKAELGLNELDLQIIRMEGWRRSDYFDATGLLWVDPSPNMRSLTEALLYPGIGLLETTNLSVGRGTDTPFEIIGAPWIDGVELAGRLNRAGLSGVAFVPIRFTPTASKFEGTECGGVNVIITDRKSFHPLRTGFEIARQLRLLYPDAWEVKAYDRLLGDEATLNAVTEGKSVEEIEAGYREELEDFRKRRERFLIY
ncbi:MAG: exo-beta-N-acetylmuramidase NamZ family protein, partial [Planctomycetaceae bacterium]